VADHGEVVLMAIVEVTYRADAQMMFSLFLIALVVATIGLDAYAFSTL
jgi:hypothetical protein